MSRSFKNPDFTSNAKVDSEKQDKKTWHSRMRARQRTAIATANDPEEIVAVTENEVCNPDAMAKDGIKYVSRQKRIEKARENASRFARNRHEFRALMERALIKQHTK